MPGDVCQLYLVVQMSLTWCSASITKDSQNSTQHIWFVFYSVTPTKKNMRKEKKYTEKRIQWHLQTKLFFVLHFWLDRNKSLKVSFGGASCLARLFCYFPIFTSIVAFRERLSPNYCIQKPQKKENQCATMLGMESNIATHKVVQS